MAEAELSAPAAGQGKAGEVLLVFLRLGLTSFGGPIAHLGYFRSEFVARRGWLAERAFADRFEAAARASRNPRRVANVLLSEVGGRLKALGLEQEQSPVSMAGIVLAADLLDEGKISSRQLKQLFDVCFEKGEDFAAVYEREKPEQISDASAIEVLINQVIAANPKQVEQYRAGKKTMAGFFVGQVMKSSKGQANPALLNELVTKKLEGY